MDEKNFSEEEYQKIINSIQYFNISECNIIDFLSKKTMKTQKDILVIFFFHFYQMYNIFIYSITPISFI